MWRKRFTSWRYSTSLRQNSFLLILSSNYLCTLKANPWLERVKLLITSGPKCPENLLCGHRATLSESSDSPCSSPRDWFSQPIYFIVPPTLPIRLQEIQWCLCFWKWLSLAYGWGPRALQFEFSLNYKVFLSRNFSSALQSEWATDHFQHFISHAPDDSSLLLCNRAPSPHLSLLYLWSLQRVGYHK